MTVEVLYALCEVFHDCINKSTLKGKILLMDTVLIIPHRIENLELGPEYLKEISNDRLHRGQQLS